MEIIQNPIIENTCIICSEGVAHETIIYSGKCTCKPMIHISCLENWYKTNKLVCPKCKRVYTRTSENYGECMGCCCVMVVIVIFILGAIGTIK